VRLAAESLRTANIVRPQRDDVHRCSRACFSLKADLFIFILGQDVTAEVPFFWLSWTIPAAAKGADSAQ